MVSPPILRKRTGLKLRLKKVLLKGFVNLFGRDIAINEDLIAEITGLSTDGAKFYKEKIFREGGETFP